MPDRNSVFAKRSLGQNFLIDEQICQQIVDALGDIHGQHVVEIGPGRGALTKNLIDGGANLTVIEKDRSLAASLRDTGKVQVIEGDILDIGLDSAFSAEFATPAKLIGNLPYNIATAILERVAETSGYFSTTVFMFQREVAERIVAEASTKGRGYLSVISQAAFEIERLFDVPPEAFRPQPKIWSTVIRMEHKSVVPVNQSPFKRIVSLGFQQKRKTLSNNLKPYFENLQSSLDTAYIDGRRRAEDLSLSEWRRLAETLDARKETA